MATQKRKHKSLMWVVAAISSLFIINAAFGIVHTFRVSSGNMYPTLPPGKMIWGTEMQKAEKGDLVFYKSTFGIKPNPSQNIQIVSRLIATAGDTVVLKNGLAWVNSKLVDEGYEPACAYMIPRSFYTQHKSALLPKEYPSVPELQPFSLPPNGSQLTLTCPVGLINKLGGSEIIPMDRPAIIPYLDRINEDILPEFRKNLPEDWTMLNWGPYIVEEGEAFILGENRSGSEDSRHRMIKTSSLKGKIW